jgi:hypothetical protein
MLGHTLTDEKHADDLQRQEKMICCEILKLGVDRLTRQTTRSFSRR